MEHSDKAGEKYHPTTQIEKLYKVNTGVIS